ncbi:hypothetical protein PIB30_092169, partial [Stylosanthes scabra]|nr:hypothetical protein [Stylosanthes scabra]
ISEKVLINPLSSLGTITHSSGYYLIRCTCRIIANREKICRIILRDAITRSNSLNVPHGNYYLVDADYTNGPGFLAPYRANKRMGSDEETKAFVGFMEEFVVYSTRSDCGQFRTMTFEKLALKIIERFPNCTLTTKHCKNKHKQMKEKYQYAADMLAHPKKFYTPGKSFPMFRRLGRIFGKDRATGSAAVSGFDAEEQVEKEADDDGPVFDEHFMLSTPTPTADGPTADGPAQTQGNVGNGAASSADHVTSSRRVSGKKRKQADILERMADEVHESTVAQREHVQILANAISGKNEEVKMGEKLAELGFANHEAIQAVIKICSDPR